jgi:hypothetical protein
MLGASLASGFGFGKAIQGHKADVVGLTAVLAVGADRTRTAHGARHRPHTTWLGGRSQIQSLMGADSDSVLGPSQR